MEKFNLSKDIGILYVTASSFPEGIGEAFKKLESLIGSTKDRVFHGISRPDIHGSIIYRAGAQETFEGEAEKLGCERFILRKGDYLVERIHDWRGQEQKIGQSFMKLLADPRLDTDYPCVEWYDGDTEVMCMIRIDPSK
jgi:hypothetical protein